MSKLYEQLQNSKVEKDVENSYRTELLRWFPKSIVSSPFATDGVLSSDMFILLMEFKYDQKLDNKLGQATVLLQCVYYLKKFTNDIPNLILCATKDMAFVIKSSDISKYLLLSLNWNIAPSDCIKGNTEVIQQMITDNDINPFIFYITPDLDVNQIKNKIISLSNSTINTKVKITKSNIGMIFTDFKKKILPNNKIDVANLFIQLIINPDDNFIHKNKLVTKNFGSISVDINKFTSFFNHIETNYTPSEKEVLVSHKDLIVDEFDRRMGGEYFTPIPFVQLGHEYITKNFGDTWKSDYVVWDCACGNANLTRDYKFTELYLSTLNGEDINTISEMGYNPESTKFQYDFLNDTFDKLPLSLQNHIKNGTKIIVLINPPYATAGANKTKIVKNGIASTVINEHMKAENWGASSQQLYAQFLYRITKLQSWNKNINIAMFTPSKYLTGDSYKLFRLNFFNEFSFTDGFLFGSGNFNGTADSWDVLFSIYKNGYENNRNNFKCDVYDIENFIPLKINEKKYYNMDKTTPASEWVRQEVKSKKTFDAPQMASFNNIKQSGGGNLIPNAIGYFYNDSNTIDKSNQSVCIFQSCFSGGHGLSIISSNFTKCNNLFSARKLMSGKYCNWINGGDNYNTPDETLESYKQFTYDSYVYCLFNNSSQQSSLRNIEYKGKNYNIKNNYFWMKQADMIELSDTNGYDSMYKDCRLDSDRYMCVELQKVYNLLSPQAKIVLDMATSLVIKSFGLRQSYSELHPEFHLDSWDSGYAQLKNLWKEFYSEDFTAFRNEYEKLGDLMRPMVYEVGFLRK